MTSVYSSVLSRRNEAERETESGLAERTETVEAVGVGLDTFL